MRPGGKVVGMGAWWQVAMRTFAILLNSLVIILLLEESVARSLVGFSILLRCNRWASRIGLVRWRWRGTVIMTGAVGNRNGEVGLSIGFGVGRSRRAGAVNRLAVDIH
jgi:hypothetical protein